MIVTLGVTILGSAPRKGLYGIKDAALTAIVHKID